MALINCSNCGKEYSDLLSVCKHCKKGEGISINSNDSNEILNIKTANVENESDTNKWSFKEKAFMVGLAIIIAAYFFDFNFSNSENNIETCVQDGTCYYGIYRAPMISADYGQYIWIGELNGVKTVYRFERVENIVSGYGSVSVGKSQGSLQSIKEDGKTIAMKIQFPFDKTYDNHRYNNWNGRWVCDGCNKITMPNKLKQEFLDDAHNWPEDWSWEDFFNN